MIELSSYQIADLHDGPERGDGHATSTAEHINWHGSEERYRRDKLRLLALPGVRRCVLNATAPAVMAAPRGDAEVLTSAWSRAGT